MNGLLRQRVCLKFFRYFLLALGFLLSIKIANAAPTYQDGMISDISSDNNGLYFRFTTGDLPTNCTGSIGNWYRISQVNQAMIAVALSFYATGVRNVVAYSSGLTADGYCNVVAFDPTE